MLACCSQALFDQLIMRTSYPMVLVLEPTDQPPLTENDTVGNLFEVHDMPDVPDAALRQQPGRNPPAPAPPPGQPNAAHRGGRNDQAARVAQNADTLRADPTYNRLSSSAVISIRLESKALQDMLYNAEKREAGMLPPSDPGVTSATYKAMLHAMMRGLDPHKACARIWSEDSTTTSRWSEPPLDQYGQEQWPDGAWPAAQTYRRLFMQQLPRQGGSQSTWKRELARGTHHSSGGGGGDVADRSRGSDVWRNTGPSIARARAPAGGLAEDSRIAALKAELAAAQAEREPGWADRRCSEEYRRRGDDSRGSGTTDSRFRGGGGGGGGRDSRCGDSGGYDDGYDYRGGGINDESSWPHNFQHNLGESRGGGSRIGVDEQYDPYEQYEQFDQYNQYHQYDQYDEHESRADNADFDAPPAGDASEDDERDDAEVEYHRGCMHSSGHDGGFVPQAHDEAIHNEQNGYTSQEDQTDFMYGPPIGAHAFGSRVDQHQPRAPGDWKRQKRT